MLNFLNHRPDQHSSSITGLRKKPAVTYGVSADSPAQFTNKFTTISQSSNINPHYKYQQQRLAKMHDTHKSKAMCSDWKNKSNINLIEEEKLFRNDENRFNNYHKNHQKELSKNSTRYRKVKGQFSGFIHDQRRNQIFGPLEGQQRTLDRANITKLKLRQESISSLQKLRSNPSLLSTYRPSNRWLQKRKLRKSRDLLYNSVKVQQQARRYRKSPEFQLPKVLKKPQVQSDRMSQYFYTIDANLTVHMGSTQNGKSKYIHN